MIEVLLIAVSAGLGAVLRYLVDTGVAAAVRGRYPAGTMVVNLTGSLLLGLLAGPLLGHPWAAVLFLGLLGGYTTFSSASLESVRLWTQGRRLAALAQGPGMVVACTALAVLGLVLTSG